MSHTYPASSTTLTITNSSGSDKLLEFSYTVNVSSTNCKVTVADKQYTASTTDAYSATLKNSSSVKITLTTEAVEESSASISITGLQLISGDQEITATFDAATGGSYTVNGTAITEKTAMTNAATTVYNLVATPANGYSFCGWINTVDNSLLASSTSASITPKDGMVIKPVFASSSEVWFLAGGKVLYNSLNDAATYASTAETTTVVLMNNGTLSSGNYTIPAGVTLVIPFNDAHTVVTTNPAVVTSYSTSTAPTAYRTLTMASGAKLILNGSLSIGGTLAASQTQGYNGLPTGKLGHIKMESGSSIEANSGSFMYIIGYIHGSGAVTVNSGATVYECFQIRDFRGGNATGTMRSGKKTFPLSQYYVQNIEVPMTLNAGAIVKGLSAFNINNAFQIPDVPFIGSTDDYLFKITDGNIVKDYEESTDRLHVQINGSLAVRPFTFEVPGFGGMASIDTNNFTLPINQNITVEVNSGKTLTINQNISLLPGAEILINEGANCVLSSGKKIIVYDSANWGSYCGEQHHSTGDDVPVKPLVFVANGAPKMNRFTTNATTLADASIKINGAVDASAGYVYVTDGGANIYSTGNGTLKLGAPPKESEDNQATQNGSSISYTGIPIYAAKLKNVDGYVETANGSANTYVYTNEKWICKDHTGGTATCTEQAKCDICGQEYGDALGHTYADPAVNFSDDGKKYTVTVTCSVCAEGTEGRIKTSAEMNSTVQSTTSGDCKTNSTTTYEASGEFEGVAYSGTKLVEGELGNHNPGAEATCTTAQTCTVCGAELVPALNHKDDDKDHVCDNKCGVEQGTHADSGTDGDHVCDYGCGAVLENCADVTTDDNHSCDVCGKENVTEHVYTEAVTPPTCTEGGFTTHTCNCGHTYTDNTVKAQHSIAQGAAQEKTCTQDGWEAYEYCTKCSHSTKVVIPAGHTLKFVEEKAASCTEAGNLAHWLCDVCGTCFADEQAQGEIADVTVPATNHANTKTINASEATCGEDGYTGDTYCEDCGTTIATGTSIPATGAHEYDEGVVTQEPTATVPGVMTYTCGTCGDSYTEEIPVVAETITIIHDAKGNEVAGVASATVEYDFQTNATGAKILSLGVKEGETAAAEGKYVFLVKYTLNDEENNAEKETGSKSNFIIPDGAADITVESGMLGDVSKNGRLNAKDVAMLKDLVGSSIVDMAFVAGDISGNGRINAKDVAQLKDLV